MRLLSLWLVLSACATNNESNKDTALPKDSAEDLPEEYIFEEEENPDALLSLGEIELGILESFEVLHSLNPTFVHDAYAQVKDEADESCPYFYEDYDYDFWSDSCETEAGAVFSGQIQYWRDQNIQDEFYDIHDEASYNGDAKVTTPQGETFVGSGYAYRSAKTGIDSPNSYHYWSMWGEYGWSGPGLEGTWIKEDYSVDFTMWSGNYYGSNWATYTSLSGGLSGLQGDINTILLREFMIYGEELGSECALEPYGTISVRDNQGNWYDVVFDGPAYWGGWAFKPYCDGCGMAYFRGEEIGPSCIDFSSWLDWEQITW